MKKYVSVFFCIICLGCYAQKKSFDIGTKYTVAQVLADIDYTEKYLTKFHPDPFRYISKDSLHAFVSGIKARIDTPLTEMQLRFWIKQIVVKIGCGHTDVSSSKAYANAIKTLNRPIFPLNTFVVDTNRLFVLNNLSKDSTIKTGDEIVSIDNRPVPKILKRIYSTYTTDGYNETYKKRGIRYDWFKYYYSFCYGFHTPYKVGIKNETGGIRNHTVNAISSLKDTVMLPKKDSVNCLFKTKKCRYYITGDQKQIAVIDIDGFSGRHWRRFMRRSFKDIKKKRISNLVIDVRDNGGGQIALGMNFLSYLVHQPTTLSFDRKPNLLPLNFRLKMDPFTRITPLLFCFRFQDFPKNGRLRHYIFTLPKHRNAYIGNTYVLINGKSFSMSCIAAAYLKYKGKATIIGEETGGNVAGSNAVINGKLILPNSKVKILVPIYHIYHHLDVENNGHGIMPDYPTFYDKEAVLNGVDVDLNKVKELVKVIN